MAAVIFVFGIGAIIILGMYLSQNYPKTFKAYVALTVMMMYFLTLKVARILAPDPLIENTSSVFTQVIYKGNEIIILFLSIIKFCIFPLALLTVVTFFRELTEKSKQRKVSKANVSYLKDYRAN